MQHQTATTPQQAEVEVEEVLAETAAEGGAEAVPDHLVGVQAVGGVGVLSAGGVRREGSRQQAEAQEGLVEGVRSAGVEGAAEAEDGEVVVMVVVEGGEEGAMVDAVVVGEEEEGAEVGGEEEGEAEDRLVVR